MAREVYTFVDSKSDLASFDSTYPSGDYVFTISSNSTSAQITATLSASMTQPNAPRVSNFDAAQAVDPSQPFTLSWDSFQGGTAADFVSVDVGGLFRSGNPGEPGALNGTATSVTIPAGKLQANTDYDVILGFYRVTGHTNAPVASAAFRATVTLLNLSTSNGPSTGSLILSNPARTGSTFSFDVTTSAGQTITVESSADMAPSSWTPVLTTNSPGTKVHITAPPSTAPHLFYRARSGA